MTGKKEKIVGILGGMGPEATVDLMQRIIQLTPALDDIDHIRCIVDNNPKIPSRIKAIIEGDGEDPGLCMADMARRLESWGVDFLAIACNTAHYYYETVSNAVKIPVINLIDLVVSHLKQTSPDCSKIGILASPAVLMTGLYEKRFHAVGIEVVYPGPVFQERLFNVIKAIKTGDTSVEVVQTYKEICENLNSSGVDSVIIACTELSVISSDLPFEIIDSAEILAREIVDVAKMIKH
ncbi:aspartate/glutamate racemase family protein [Desulfobacula sp.]|uniref:aspartate/glutamate racemase family protein n=1 Tax=Desulfobacula sp. TaxID=2593537 RepID=UPI002615D0C0|nr:amino acid racemase [Desulfobacula sp.]